MEEVTDGTADEGTDACLGAGAVAAKPTAELGRADLVMAEDVDDLGFCLPNISCLIVAAAVVMVRVRSSARFSEVVCAKICLGEIAA